MDLGLSSADALSAAALTAPGAIFLYTREQFLTGRTPGAKDGLTTYFLVSVIFHSLSAFLFGSYYIEFLDDPINNRVLMLFSILVPTCMGIYSGIMGGQGYFSDLLHFLFGANSVHPIGSAWDWHFSRGKEGWVIVSLKNGTQWGGLYGRRSFASSEVEERDLLIEKVYVLDCNGGFLKEKESSVLICKDEIVSIEIWPR